ncbi:MAG: hypothetical protein FJ267_08710, partial [Planctomycetes bacterium]|nr:hypothetical protein [Planctomycetota bacterium]
MDQTLWETVAKHMSVHWDVIYADMLRAKHASVSQAANTFGMALKEASSFQPRAIVWNLELQPALTDAEAAALDEKFLDQPEVMLALGYKLGGQGRYTDAERCLKKSIAIRPTHNAYYALA